MWNGKWVHKMKIRKFPFIYFNVCWWLLLRPYQLFPFSLFFCLVSSLMRFLPSTNTHFDNLITILRFFTAVFLLLFFPFFCVVCILIHNSIEVQRKEFYNQQAIHVVSHTWNEKKREKNELVWSQLFNYLWQLEIFCLFSRFGGWRRHWISSEF